MPITLSSSEPEPDIAVVRSEAEEYSDRHPVAGEILLLIEVAHTTTLEIDRQQKAPIYALHEYCRLLDSRWNAIAKLIFSDIPLQAAISLKPVSKTVPPRPR